MTEALALIPWGENKVTRLASWVKTKQRMHRRVQEYKQFLQWTQASLQVSTAFDWGHTCELADAISTSATELFGGNPGFLFTSRTLLSKSFGEPIDSELWLQVVKRLVTSDACLEEPRVDPRFLPDTSSEFEERLAMHWLLSDPDTMPDWNIYKTGTDKGNALRETLKSQLSATMNGEQRWEDWTNAAFQVGLGIGADIGNDMKPVMRETVKSEKVLRLLQHMCDMLSSDVDTTRCCDNTPLSRRKRALQVRNCKGLQLSPIQADDAKPFNEENWRTLRTL